MVEPILPVGGTYRVVRETDDRGHPGRWNYHIVDFPATGQRVRGFSRQPLLEACRTIKRMGGDGARVVELSREGRSDFDVRCSVEAGAALTTVDRDHERIRFTRYRPFSRARALKAAAE